MEVALTEPAPLAEVDEWKEALARPRAERAAVYSEPQWRDRARNPTLARWEHRWPRMSVQETQVHRDLVGIPLDPLASARAPTPVDPMIDPALADSPATRFPAVLDNDGNTEI